MLVGMTAAAIGAGSIAKGRLPVRLRPLGRTRALIHLLLALSLVPRWLWRGPAWSRHRTRQWLFFARIARGFAPRIRVSGAVHREATLFVANHISWLDIPILGSKLRTDFVAKDDVASWPGLGPLARRSATLFVSRERRGHALAQTAAIAARLAARQRLLLFAEGTTSDGSRVLPFRSSLFAAALEAGVIQPVMIGYRWAGGGTIGDADMARIGWTGDATLIGNAADIATMPLRAEIRMLAPIRVEPGDTRRTLAARCEAAIAGAYAAFRAENRPA